MGRPPKPKHEDEPASIAAKLEEEAGEAKLEAEAHEKAAPVTKKLRMQAGTDEVTHGDHIYRVAQGAAKPEGYVELPPEAAEHVLRQGGAVLIEEGGAKYPHLMVSVRHVSDPKASFTFHGKVHEPDKKGLIHVSAEALGTIQAHGFELVPEKE